MNFLQSYIARMLAPCLWVSLLLVMPLAQAQDDKGEDNAPLGPAANEGQDPGLGLVPNGAGDFAGGGGAVNPIDLDEVRDALNPSFVVPADALAIFPAEVQNEVQDLMGRLLPELASQDESRIQRFFDIESDNIAIVFDRLGIKPTADGLLAGPEAAAPPEGGGEPVADGDATNGRQGLTSTIKFPHEFDNYEAYLETLKIDPADREYLARSHRISEAYRQSMRSQLTDDAMQDALSTYQQELRRLNEEHGERLRTQLRDAIEQTTEDGRRPDVDR